MAGPTDPTRADCWTSYYGRMTMAIYVAETLDRDWFLLRLQVSGRNFNRWTHRDEITEWLRTPARVVREKKAERRQAYGPRYNGEAAQLAAGGREHPGGSA